MKKALALVLMLVVCLAVPGLALAAEPNSLVISGRDATVPVDTEVDSVVVISGDAHIFGRVREAVVAIGGSIYLEPGAEVYGDVVSLGGTINLASDAHVGGQQVSLGSFSLENVHIGPFFTNWLGFNLSIWRLLSILFLGLVTQWLLPQQVKRSSAALEQNPLRSVVFALLGYLALVPLTILLVITILGIPLVPLLWLLVAAGRLLGQVALGLLAGRWLAPRLNLHMSEQYHVLLGLLVLGALTALPVVGGLASLFYGLVGFGAVLWTRFGTRSALALPKE